MRREVSSIGPYLVPGSAVIVQPAQRHEWLPGMDYGNKATDGGHLILSPLERAALIGDHPEAAEFVRPLMGSQEFIKGITRFCLWIPDGRVAAALEIPEIARRVEAVRAFRAASASPATRQAMAWSHRFIQSSDPRPALIVPVTSSDRRCYLPAGFTNAETVISSNAFSAYDAPRWALAVISSGMHRAWIGVVSGKYGGSLQYLSTLCWNTFPIARLPSDVLEALDATALGILAARDRHPGKTIADLYDPDRMPDDLRAAHAMNDAVFEKAVAGRYLGSDDERLEWLLAAYAQRATI